MSSLVLKDGKGRRAVTKRSLKPLIGDQVVNQNVNLSPQAPHHPEEDKTLFSNKKRMLRDRVPAMFDSLDCGSMNEDKCRSQASLDCGNDSLGEINEQLQMTFGSPSKFGSAIFSSDMLKLQKHELESSMGANMQIRDESVHSDSRFNKESLFSTREEYTSHHKTDKCMVEPEFFGTVDDQSTRVFSARKIKL